MTPDHYAVLGLTPTSQDVVIRAAYVALARLYHPDINPSAEAAAHTREINEAYAVLGVPERRAEYDKQRMEAAWVPDRPVKRRSPSALFAAAAISVLALVAFLFVREPLPSRELPFGIPYGAGDEMAGLEPAPQTSALDPQSGLRQAPGQDGAAGEPQLPLPPPMARFASRPAPAPPPAPVANTVASVARRSAPAPAPKATPIPVATPDGLPTGELRAESKFQLPLCPDARRNRRLQERDTCQPRSPASHTLQPVMGPRGWRKAHQAAAHPPEIRQPPRWLPVGQVHQRRLPRAPARGELDHDGSLTALLPLFSPSRPCPQVRRARACPAAARRWA